MNGKRNGLLDLFRAILCIAVLLYHLEVLKGGFLAVCGFLVGTLLCFPEHSCFCQFAEPFVRRQPHHLIQKEVVALVFPALEEGSGKCDIPCGSNQGPVCSPLDRIVTLPDPTVPDQCIRFCQRTVPSDCRCLLRSGGRSDGIRLL